MTTVPESYDFNQQYGVLPVYDQGSNPSCWTEAHILALTALRHVHFTDEAAVMDWMPFRSSGVSLENDWNTPRYGRWQMTAADGEQHEVWGKGESFNMNDHAAMQRELIENAIVDAAIYATPSFQAVWNQKELPVIYPTAEDVGNTYGHEQIFVGYTPLGVITQNSWGYGWGCKGRAILSWEWLALYCPAFLPQGIDMLSFDPISELPPPRVQPEENPLFKGYHIKKLSKPAQYFMVGANRFWIRTTEMAQQQGLGPDTLQVLPDDHPYFTAAYPIIGAQPPASAQ